MVRLARERRQQWPAAGADEFVELGGKVLGSMVKRIAPDAKVTSVRHDRGYRSVGEGDCIDVSTSQE